MSTLKQSAMMLKSCMAVVICSVVLTACGFSKTTNAEDSEAIESSGLEAPQKYGAVSEDRLLDVDNTPGDWLTGGRDYQQSYYSPATQINKDNVDRLGFAWEYEIDTQHGFEATPIVVDGIMFTSGPRGAAYALNARSGKAIWTFEPEISPSVMQKLCCGVVNRGVAVWDGMVFVGALDGVLYALDAATGKIIWQVDTIIDRARAYSVTGAPYIANGKVIIGNGGAEFDARGYITAYDYKTGKEVWRFFTVPGDPAKGFENPELEMAATTWDPDSLWEVGLGGTAWDAMAWDPKLNLLYIGTGNGAPWVRKFRSPKGGDNLFLSTILAIDPETGKLVWHYQTTPSDNWDYTATQKLILADLEIDGKARQVIMQAPKNGFFYVLDRKTGELISAEKYVPVNWASHVDMVTGRPVETGQGEYFDEPKLIFPGSAGGHNWQPMSYDPGTGLVYIPAFVLPMIYDVTSKDFSYEKGGANFAATITFPIPGPFGLDGEAAKKLPPIETLAAGQPDYTPRGFLKAWDPVKQELVWEKETSGDWAGHFFSAWNGGGLMSSAGGLLFQGQSTGDLVIMDAETGDVLREIDLGVSVMAAPMTYKVDGEQYVAVMAGLGGAFGNAHLPGTAAYKYGNTGRIMAFKLDGGDVPARLEITHKDLGNQEPPVPRFGTAEEVSLGSDLFQRHCAICHAGSSGTVPNLAEMSADTHAEFKNIVLMGARANRGMGAFGDLLSDTDAEAIHAYLTDVAWQNYERGQAGKAPHSMKE
nr:PQQ-dependent dehydrogenase, methanol/ethanol family [uncultured Hyphomonas sp.]